ncbi:MAG: RNA polymerase sigma factor [Acidobacteria bacterium]|nr:RNA polymerase sigma factor [Acidobacteriota bacterium]
MSDSQSQTKEEQFERLFKVYYRPVSYYFARRGCSRDECHDLTQETFMGVYRGMESYREESSLETWLFVIAANIWRNWLRGRSTQKRSGTEVSLGAEALSPDRSLAERLAAPDPGSLQRLLSSERYRLLVRELEALPPRMRFCFLLRFFQGLKYKEIASIMGVSLETVKSQLFQARERLRERLEGHFGED